MNHLLTHAERQAIAAESERRPYMSRDEAGTMAGLRAFDCALPHDWTVDVHDAISQWPQNLPIVWCYDRARTFGEPVALTPDAAALLNQYECRTWSPAR